MNKDIIKLIKAGASISEISSALNLTHKEIYEELLKFKNNGYSFDKKYFYDGSLRYSLNYNFSKSNNTRIEIDSNTFRSVIISDLHIGSSLERIDLLNQVYNYCIKNEIHIIINGGDLVNGMFGVPSIHDNHFDQINYLLDKYPECNNILTFVLLGNHDVDSLLTSGIDLKCVLENYKHSIIPIGYGNAKILIKNDSLTLVHPLGSVCDYKYTGSNSNLILRGHGHMMKLSDSMLYLPTLSDIFTHGDMYPGFLDITITFDEKNKFKLINLKHLIFDDELKIKSELEFDPYDTFNTKIKKKQ